MNELNKYCSCGGCTGKIGADTLSSILHKIPKTVNPNLLIGMESSDDAAVYKLNEDTALVQTLDFFSPIVADPYTFGKIAATNALSDVYAMGGEVLMALNIVCFPEKMDINILGEILRGGAEKVAEAGGVLCGGHSLIDPEPKYGLSVTGVVHPEKLWANNNCKIGDKLILTKPLGIGIITAAEKVGEASAEAFEKAIDQMQTLNKYAAQIAKKYRVHAATDITGFGFLGRLYEMCKKGYSISVDAQNVPYIPEALAYAKNFVITAAGQKNRNFLSERVAFLNVEFALQEILFDPQTSGGLLLSVNPEDCDALLKELSQLSLQSAVVGEVVERLETDILVRGELNAN